MRFAGVLAVMMLAGCVALGAKDSASPTGAGPDKAPKPNPIYTTEITTTSLDTVVPETKPAQDQPAKAEPPVKADEKDEAKAEPPEEVVSPTPVAPPPEPKTPAEVKCLKTGGIWADAGKSGAKTCIKRTKDAGKSCSKQTQCEGLCLSRSRSCAPITPMFGCNEILQADGRAATLCLD